MANPGTDALLELASLQDLSFFIDTVQKYAIDNDLLLCISFLLHLSDDYACNLSYFATDWDTMRAGERIVRLDEIEMMKRRFHGEHWDPLMAVIARRCLEGRMRKRERILTYEEAVQMLRIAPMSVFRLVPLVKSSPPVLQKAWGFSEIRSRWQIRLGFMQTPAEPIFVVTFRISFIDAFNLQPDTFIYPISPSPEATINQNTPPKPPSIVLLKPTPGPQHQWYAQNGPSAVLRLMGNDHLVCNFCGKVVVDKEAYAKLPEEARKGFKENVEKE
ncbi:hypothetical protein K440DRAFT_637723 [Wilcoxina mikolae CBS 423.85]|nr:hypothetical protein K440DRAFT_637723 [Wilcoxina mikolae CBS 423.85]